MAETPLLLTMLAKVGTRTKLPERRVELYHEVVQQLLYQWEGDKAREGNLSTLEILLDRPDPPIDKGDFEHMLRRLTYQAHANSGKRTAEIGEEDLEKALKDLYVKGGRSQHDAKSWASRVLELMRQRSGLLVPADEHSFSFPHRGFQEYLAARWLFSLGKPGKEALKLVENDIWHEVILLTCAYATTRHAQSYLTWDTIVSKLARGMKRDGRRWQAQRATPGATISTPPASTRKKAVWARPRPCICTPAEPRPRAYMISTATCGSGCLKGMMTVGFGLGVAPCCAVPKASLLPPATSGSRTTGSTTSGFVWWSSPALVVLAPEC